MTSVYRNTIDSYYFRWLLVALAFILVNFSARLGQIYIAIIIADYVWQQADKKRSIKFEKSTEGRLQSVLIAAVSTGIFLFLTGLILKVFSPETLSVVESATQSVFHLLSTTIPAFEGSDILTIISFGFIIAIIESHFFFGTLFEGVRDFYHIKVGTKIDLFKLDKKIILLVLTISSAFVLFHLTAKGARSILLLTVFIFAIIQLWLVNRYKHLREAVMMHVMTNTLSVLYSLGLMPDI